MFLKNYDAITYLGVVLSNESSKNHVYSRISSCRKAFYSLQNTGLCKDGLNIKTSVFLWNIICQSSLTYGCESISLSKQNLIDIEKTQSKLVKCFVGIGKSYRSTPLLNALNIKKNSHIVFNQNINLFRNIFSTTSAAQKLNLYFINDNIDINGTLYSRVRNICNSFNLVFQNCIFNDVNLRDTFYSFPKCGEDGLIDSLRRLLYETDVDREMLKLRLRSF